MVTYESRRDLQHPLRFFQALDVVHLYRRAPWPDFDEHDVPPATHTFRSPPHLYLRLARLKPDIVQALEPFSFEILPFNLAVLLYAMTRRKPLVVVSLCNVPVTTQYGRLLGGTLNMLLRPLLRRARLAVFVNEGARQSLLAAGAPPERLVRLMFGCWGVDPAELRPGPSEMSLRKRAGERIVLFVGRIDPSKGVFDLLEAFGRLRRSMAVPLRLVLAGDGPAIDIVRAWIRNRGLEPTIDLLGQVMNRDVPALMRAADVLAAPSVSDRRWAEQVGMVLLQAMASGLPLVTTRSGSIPEFVDDGETGLLVPERDPAALSLALRRVLSDAALCARLAENGRRVASERYDAAANVRLAEAAILAACGWSS